MKDLWSKMERYEKKIAAVVVVLAVIVLVSTRFDRVDEGGMVNTGENPVVNIQQAATGVSVDEWNLFVVKSGDCYSVGDDEGWVALDECYTLGEAKLKAARLKAAHKRRIAAEKATWIKVE